MRVSIMCVQSVSLEDEKILKMNGSECCTKMCMWLIPLTCTFKNCSSSTISGVCVFYHNLKHALKRPMSKMYTRQ